MMIATAVRGGLPWPRLVLMVFLVGAALLTAACQAPPKPTGKKGGPAGPAKVQTTAARGGPLDVVTIAFGEVRPMLESALSVGVAGEVEEIRAREGDAVKTGDVLVVLDQRLIRAQLAEASAALKRVEESHAQATREVERLRKLGPKVVPRVELERQESAQRALVAQLDQLRSTIRQVRAQQARHTTRAPFDGIIRTRVASPGDWLNPGQTALTMTAPRRLEVHVQVHPDLLAHIKEGAEATIQRGAEGQQQVAGEVVGIVRTLDARSRTVRLRVSPKQPVDWLLANDTVRVAFHIKRDAPQAVVIPQDALVLGAASTTRVMVARQSKADAVPIIVLAQQDDQALVRAVSGAALATGDAVVVRGNERLRPGQDLAATTYEEPSRRPTPTLDATGKPLAPATTGGAGK